MYHMYTYMNVVCMYVKCTKYQNVPLLLLLLHTYMYPDTSTCTFCTTYNKAMYNTQQPTHMYLRQQCRQQHFLLILHLNLGRSASNNTNSLLPPSESQSSSCSSFGPTFWWWWWWYKRYCWHTFGVRMWPTVGPVKPSGGMKFIFATYWCWVR
jgi:hypothetical protein